MSVRSLAIPGRLHRRAWIRRLFLVIHRHEIETEILYILGVERDLIDLRTSHRNEDVYLYPLVLP